MKYDIFLIDPPWPKKKGGLRKTRPNQNKNLSYKTMTVKDIFSLLDGKIFSKAEKKHTVFLWNVDQFLTISEKEMSKRGYKLHARLIWNKKNGVAPAFSVRYSHEYLNWYYKPSFTPVSKKSRGKITTVFTEKSREHSRKPDCVYETIDFWFPHLSKLDVFSREKRDNWNQFGDQKTFFI